MGIQTGQGTTTQIIPNIVQNKVSGTPQQQAGTLTVAVSSGAPTNIVGANLVPQIQRQTSVSTAGKKFDVPSCYSSFVLHFSV